MRLRHKDVVLLFITIPCDFVFVMFVYILFSSSFVQLHKRLMGPTVSKDTSITHNEMKWLQSVFILFNMLCIDRIYAKATVGE